MRGMLSFLIARETMHQNQWLAVIEDLGGFTSQFPIRNSFSQASEKGILATNTSSPRQTGLFGGALERGPKH